MTAAEKAHLDELVLEQIALLEPGDALDEVLTAIQDAVGRRITDRTLLASAQRLIDAGRAESARRPADARYPTLAAETASAERERLAAAGRRRREAAIEAVRARAGEQLAALEELIGALRASFAAAGPAVFLDAVSAEGDAASRFGALSGHALEIRRLRLR